MRVSDCFSWRWLDASNRKRPFKTIRRRQIHLQESSGRRDVDNSSFDAFCTSAAFEGERNVDARHFNGSTPPKTSSELERRLFRLRELPPGCSRRSTPTSSAESCSHQNSTVRSVCPLSAWRGGRFRRMQSVGLSVCAGVGLVVAMKAVLIAFQLNDAFLIENTREPPQTHNPDFYVVYSPAFFARLLAVIFCSVHVPPLKNSIFHASVSRENGTVRVNRSGMRHEF